MQPTPYLREPGYAVRYRDRRFRTGHGARTDERERRAVRALLARVAAPAGPWLDVPAGAGRMTGELPAGSVQVDRDPAMLVAAAAAAGPGPRACGCATALPFAAATFAGGLCCRLLQHLPTAAERIAVLRELRRTCRGPVIVSFFDACSLLHLRRVVRRAVGKNRSGRSAISRAAFRREAAAAGFRVTALRSLGRFVAEQTFALCTPAE